MSTLKKSPIVLLSFNRPGYLEALLFSLTRQIGADISDRTIAIFQDGAGNPFDDELLAQQTDIDSCLELFKKILPWGQVFASEQNLGVAMNFDRAEKFVFEELGAPSAIFLEDDLLLSEHYINVLDHLTAYFADDERVGYISAYGDHELSLELQWINKHKLMALHHNWAFSVYRRQWLRMRPYVEAYHEYVLGRRYSMRDHTGIANLFASWGYGTPGTSQDCAKSIACCATNTLKVNTVACFGRYIGEKGFHMDPLLFQHRRYDETQVISELVTEFEPMSLGLSETISSDLNAWAGNISSKRTTKSFTSTIRSLARIKSSAIVGQMPAKDQPLGSWKRVLYRFSEGESLNRRIEKLFHLASEEIGLGDVASAQLIAAKAIAVLFESLIPQSSVFAGFYPRNTIRDIENESHIRIDFRNSQIRAVCPADMLSPHFTNYFEAFVLVSVLLRSMLPSSKDVGAFTVDLGNGSDSGEYPRISFSSSLSQATLVVDPEFFFSDGFAVYRKAVNSLWVPWRNRANRAFWRGKTTGIRTGHVENAKGEKGENLDWSWLQRLQFCDKARRSPHSEWLDVGISEIVQINDEKLVQSIVNSGLMREEKRDSAIMGYRFLFALDGNTSVGNGLIEAFLSGSCVFLVASVFNFRSWYYDQLEPWVTHIPINADLTDLDERLDWAYTHPLECENIASSGFQRASNMALDREWERSVERLRTLITL